MNKKKVILFLMVATTILSTFLFITNKNKVEITNTINNKIKNNRGLLTMNLEQTAGVGDYKQVTQSNWPTEGYKFNDELSKCENNSTLSWNDINKTLVFSGNVSDKCYVYFDKIFALTEYIISQYTGVQGENNIYYHDSSLENGAEDNSYRYAGANPNNFVCFGSNEDPCPTSSLYRIIGVFNGQVKLISSEPATIEMLGTDGDYYLTASTLDAKYNGDYNNSENLNIGVYSWNANTSDINWSTSNLNNINLNKNFIHYLKSDWSSIIATTTWKVSKNIFSNISLSSIKQAYQYEIINPESSTSYEAKIGLPYVNDYGYAADSSKWSGRYSNYAGLTKNLTLDNNNYLDNGALDVNWMYKGINEWSITTYTDSSGSPFFLPVSQSMPLNICDLNVIKINIYARPTFYLIDGALYKSGIGTKSYPIRLIVN